MNRREALSRVAIIMGGTIVGGVAFLEGCKTATKKLLSVCPLPKNRLHFLMK